MDQVDLVAIPAKVGERPVNHVLALRGAVDGDEDLTLGNGKVDLHLFLGTLVGVARLGGGGGDLRGSVERKENGEGGVECQFFGALTRARVTRRVPTRAWGSS